MRLLKQVDFICEHIMIMHQRQQEFREIAKLMI
jgi:hypothetical protein